MIGGVCGGLADYSGIDSLLWRVGFVGLTLAGGAGIVVYLLLWVFMPSAPLPPGVSEPPAGCSSINVSNVNGLYAFHPSGVNILLGDGSVRFLRESTSPGVLAAMITRNGGEPLQGE